MSGTLISMLCFVLTRSGSGSSSVHAHACTGSRHDLAREASLELIHRRPNPSCLRGPVMRGNYIHTAWIYYTSKNISWFLFPTTKDEGIFVNNRSNRESSSYLSSSGAYVIRACTHGPCLSGSPDRGAARRSCHARPLPARSYAGRRRERSRDP